MAGRLSMEQKNRHTYRRIERMSSHRRSPSPEYFVDLTVDSPVNQSGRTQHRRVYRIDDVSSQPESSQITTLETPELELIDCSNRLLPPKKRSRTSKTAKTTTLIHLDETPSPSEAACINDSTSGETSVITCPICLEYLTSKRKPTATRCGHIYCSECIEQTLAMSKKCPKCQSNITQKSCTRLYF